MAKRKKPATIAIDPGWKQAFRSYSVRVGFAIALSKPMLEFLCAVSDNAEWDRGLPYNRAVCCESYLATSRCLEKRGLITKKKLSHDEALQMIDDRTSSWTLTPAGEKLIELIKVAGVFVEADVAASRRA